MTPPTRRYVVVRPAADLPAGFLPSDLDGRWYDMDMVPKSVDHDYDGDTWDWLGLAGGAVAVATDRFESREDGALAQVYEVRP